MSDRAPASRASTLRRSSSQYVQHRIRGAQLAALHRVSENLSARRTATYTRPDSSALFLAPESVSGSAGEVFRRHRWQVRYLPLRSALVNAETYLLAFGSTSAAGESIPITGTVMVPRTRWRGDGLRPLTVVGSGTVGTGNHCAPSKMLRSGQHYDIGSITALLRRGFAVAVPDYEGLGFPGAHPYLNRRSLGQSVLDMARAARSADIGIAPEAPVILWGYSEGGLAAGGAAELAATYAPELPVTAAYVGAPAPDLRDLAQLGDGSLLSGGLGWVVNGFTAAYPQLTDQLHAAFNDRGLALLAEVRDMSILDAARMSPFTSTADFTVDGRPIADHLDEDPWVTLVDEQRLGRVRPSMPVFVGQNRADDVVSTAGTERMVSGWLSLGADVTTYYQNLPSVLPGTMLGHVLGLSTQRTALRWLDLQVPRAA